MVGAFILITLGILLLLNNLYPAFPFTRTWPVILIVVGLVKVAEFIRSSLRSEHRSGPDEPGREQVER